MDLLPTLCVATVAVLSGSKSQKSKQINRNCELNTTTTGPFQMYFNHLVIPNTEKCTIVLQLSSHHCLVRAVTPHKGRLATLSENKICLGSEESLFLQHFSFT